MGDFIARAVGVRAPATSANLGPGFDSFGLALDAWDAVEAQVTSARTRLDIFGEGAATLPRDDSHLVLKAMRAAFESRGVTQPALRLTCRNTIPQGRGLGSSAAAIVSGIRLADALLGGEALSSQEMLTLATTLEGHPDNVAACLLGSFTIAWVGQGGPRAVRLHVHPDIRPLVFVPPAELSTVLARGLLPSDVPHSAASANAGRAGLLVAAMTTLPGLLLEATEDALHQEYRRPAMPASLALVDALRAAGVAAVVSGAGPGVLALATSGDTEEVRRRTPPGWEAKELAVAQTGVTAV
jgi:homoserine kinase